MHVGLDGDFCCPRFLCTVLIDECVSCAEIRKLDASKLMSIELDLSARFSVALRSDVSINFLIAQN